MSDWRKIELQLSAQTTCRTSRFELTTFKRGVIWIDQVSLMPSDTYKVNRFFFICNLGNVLATNNHKGCDLKTAGEDSTKMCNTSNHKTI
jgi:hypothetical protein